MSFPPAPDLGLCFNRAMRRASNRLVGLYDEALAPCGLLAIEFAILGQIERANGTGLAELADAFFMDRPSFRYKVVPLEKANLVAFVTDRRDRRVRRAMLTETGRRKLAEATVLWREAQDRVEAALGPRQAATFRATADVIASSAFADAFRA